MDYCTIEDIETHISTPTLIQLTNDDGEETVQDTMPEDENALQPSQEAEKLMLRERIEEAVKETYRAMPKAGVEKLVDFMAEFEKANK